MNNPNEIPNLFGNQDIADALRIKPKGNKSREISENHFFGSLGPISDPFKTAADASFENINPFSNNRSYKH